VWEMSQWSGLARRPGSPVARVRAGYSAAMSDGPLTEHQPPAGVDDKTIEALGKLSEALEAVEVARGNLYTFHRLSGTADLPLAEALELFRAVGHGELADRIARDLGRNLLEGRWTFQVVEEYDATYYAAFRDLEQLARDQLVDGLRHLHEARMKEDERTNGARHHEPVPDDSGPQGDGS
jgi:hypothetical protein